MKGVLFYSTIMYVFVVLISFSPAAKIATKSLVIKHVIKVFKETNEN